MARIVRRSRRPLGVRPRRRRKVWARTNIFATIAANTAGGFDLLEDFQTALGADLVGSTLLAIRGTLAWAPAANENIRGVAAVMIDTRPVGGVVTPRLPGTTERYGDWLMYEPIIHAALTIGTAEYPQRIVLNGRSARKIDEINQTAVLWIHNYFSGLATSFNVVGTVSSLLALP
jgi:hypothetical protein